MATILIIDDDPNTLGLMRTRLEKSGYTVKEAKDGAAGIKIAENQLPQLIFLDVRMPKLDGWQVCRTLKSNPMTRQCPVVMLTGCSQDAQELYGRQCGADEYLTKPWDNRELLKLIERMLDQSAAAQDLRSDVARARIKKFVETTVRVAGLIPKSPNTELLSGQLVRLATQLLATFEEALNASTADFHARLGVVDHQAGELIYWLGLLRDSKVSDHPDIALLIAEATALRRNLK
jgi:twitching motility two-component system response regulator PilH